MANLQIKDMPLKNEINGEEDVLIQDNGVTKRVKAGEFGKDVDLSGYYTKSEVDMSIAGVHWNDDMMMQNGVLTVTNANGRCVTDFILCPGDTEVSWMGDASSTYGISGLAFYDENELVLEVYGGIGADDQVHTCISPTNTRYLRLGAKTSQKDKARLIISGSASTNILDNELKRLEEFKIDGEIDVTNYMLTVNILESAKYKDTTGVIVSDSTYNATSMTKLDKTKPMFCGAVYNSHAVFYDEDKKYISMVNFYDGTPINVSAYPENAVYVAFDYYNTTLCADKMYVSTINTKERKFAYSSIKKYKGMRPQVYITTDMSEDEIFLTMLDAWYTGDCDVHFEYGTYTFDSIYEKMSTTYKWGDSNELIIGRNCRYFLNNSTIISKISGSTYRPHSIFGTHRWGDAGSFELNDGTLILYDGIYCVHDECSGGTTPYIHKYKNIKMKYIKGEHSTTINRCIGGGTGMYGEILIENCTFETDNTSSTKPVYEVAYHGNKVTEDARDFKLTVTNSIFSNGGLLLDWLGDGETGICRFTGNMSVNGVKNNDESKWTVMEWNNITTQTTQE